ncbi:MAG: hypothetical protein WDW36_000586 [Sanguina aurantia]
MVLYFTPRGHEEGKDDWLIYMGKDKFHVDDMSSSHVHLRLPEGAKLDDIPPEALEDCAQLVKHNSIQGCKSSSVTVVYTFWANLKKTGSMEVGQVGFHNNREVRKYKVEKRSTEIVNRMEKTKQERHPDLAEERLAYEAGLRSVRNAEGKASRAALKIAKDEHRKAEETKSYKTIMQQFSSSGRAWTAARRTWQLTDDSELAISLLRGLVGVRPQDGFPAEAVARKYNTWMDADDPFDVGGTCGAAFSNASCAADMYNNALANQAEYVARWNSGAAANGGLMRIAPLAIWAHARTTNAELIALAKQDALLSHPSEVCQDANAVYCVAIAALLKSGRAGGSSTQERAATAIRAVDSVIGVMDEVIQRWYRDSSTLTLEEIVVTHLIGHVKHAFLLAFYFLRRGTAYDVAIVETCRKLGDSDTNAAIHAFKLAFFFLHKRTRFEEALAETCRKLGDTDTNCAVVGAVMGALHGKVNIGSLLDPVGLDGLAHFTEHMLFYSSAKYPVEDEYSKYVSDHGGHTNAWTASENTNYQFDVNWDALEPTLDRFAQFFISPAISADGVDREVKAVDSEHGKNLATDAWRQLQLYKHTANPAHPWARFATGNLETLGAAPRAAGVDVRDAVAAFHATHYSANLMRLAVVGRQSLDEMEGWVRAMFSGVPNKDLPIPSFSPSVFLPSQMGTLLRMVPVRDVQSLELAWQVPPSQPQYKQAPLSVLSHLLGHEGTGSLFSLLKSLGWASSLVAGESGSSMSCASFFYISVELTLEGYAHVQEVGASIFSYLALLQRDGIPCSVYDELVALQRLRFEFRDKPSPYAYASGLAGCMQIHGDEDLLLGMYHVPQIYDPEAISASLQQLTLDGVRACWVSKELLSEATSSEPWLHLPEPNPFVPTDFSLHTAEPSVAQAHPHLLVHIPGSLSLHHKTDLTFNTPKAVIYLDFQTPEAYAPPTKPCVC